MSHLAVHIHMVWGNKKHEPLLLKPQRYELFKEIRSNAKAKDIYIMETNGHIDHVHILIALKANQNLADIPRDLKGGSSFRANNIAKDLLQHKLEWASRYYAASVSESGVPDVRKYIQNQETHHTNTIFRQEFEKFIERFGFTEILEQRRYDSSSGLSRGG